MTNDKDSAVTQADIDAAKLYLQGTGPWALDEIGIGPDDSLAIAFARHRIASSQPTQSDALRIACEALEPFADLATGEVADSKPDNLVFILMYGGKRYAATSMKNLRDAKAALAALQKKG